MGDEGSYEDDEEDEEDMDDIEEDVKEEKKDDGGKVETNKALLPDDLAKTEQNAWSKLPQAEKDKILAEKMSKERFHEYLRTIVETAKAPIAPPTAQVNLAPAPQVNLVPKVHVPLQMAVPAQVPVHVPTHVKAKVHVPMKVNVPTKVNVPMDVHVPVNLGR